LAKPERIAEIEADYARRLERFAARRRLNPLADPTSAPADIDDVFGIDEASGGCVICHK